MRNKWLLAFVVGLPGLFGALPTGAQTAKTPTVGQYIISAKAGGVNFVSGKVTVMHRAGTSGSLLEGDEVQIGDRVTTGDDGMAEILLNPGSYLRLGSKTSFEFASTDLEDLRMMLRAGSAVFEIIATQDFRVSVRLPKLNIQLNTSGVFRIDVLQDGFGTLSVYKGHASIGTGKGTEVGVGHTALLTTSGVSVTKFDRNAGDALDVWSKERAKELTKLNAKFDQNTLRNSLLSSFNGGGWNLYNSFGLWVFDPRFGRSLFLPFGYGWSSPYGWGYEYDLWRCRMPNYVWNPTYYPPTPTGGGPPVSPSTERPRGPKNPPPFARVEKETQGRGGMIGYPGDRSETRSGSDTKGSSPVFSPPIIAPAPSTVRPPDGSKGRPDK